MDQLRQRVERIHAALNTTVERDMARLPATVEISEELVSVLHDFSGGSSAAELENLSQSLIHNVAHLRDHLKKWAKANDRCRAKVDDAIRNSFALQVISDLANVDKHGGAGRESWSGKQPRLTNVTRSLRMATREEEGSWMVVVFGRTPIVSGDGSAEAVLTGDVLDEDGCRIGDLHTLAGEAVAAWEELLRCYGLAL